MDEEKNKLVLPLFGFRDQQLDLDKYEELLGFKFPPIYKAFFRNYKPAPKGQYIYLKRTEEEKRLIDSDFRLISSLAYSPDARPNSIEDDQLSFETFKTIDSLLKFCVPDPEEEDVKDMIYISEHGNSDGLLLGIGEDNQDKIFLYSELNLFTGDNVVTFFAENIFDLLFKCQIVEDHVDEFHYKSIRKIKNNQLYKNWGEDFWRMREEKKEV